MPSESIKPNPQHQSLESLQNTFKQRLDIILNKQLTIENIETFADQALAETIQLTEDILKEYRINPKFNTGLIPLNKQEQENEAFKILEIQDINKILQSIIDKKEQIDSLKIYIKTNTENIDRVITPTHGGKIEPGDGTFEAKRMLPRLLTLLYILENDFDISPSPENISIIKGIVTTRMVRQTPYVRVEIPDMERVVYICDEEGNASYIFDTTKLTEKGLTLEALDLESKGDRNSLIEEFPGIGVRIIQSKNWRNHIAIALQEEIPEIPKEITEASETNKSEFRERPQWLSFKEFQNEVKGLYPGKGGVRLWYNLEQKKHSNWPSHPDENYKDKGWIDWPELVGKENFFKKEYLPFKDFQTEVRNLYHGYGDVEEWYSQEYKKHHHWPSAPNVIYKDKGWIGWPKLVGKKEEYLSFEDFQIEVRNLYSDEGDVFGWYIQEYKKHKNWPSNPPKKYKGSGWKGYPELVGKENRLKKK